MRTTFRTITILYLLIFGLTIAGAVEAKSSDMPSRVTLDSSDSKASAALAETFVCDHTIGNKVGTADGRENYSEVQPGDTVCIAAGTRNNLTLENFTGTADKPITFVNHGGQVLLNGTDDFAITVDNSRYVRLTGSGDPNYEYGIKVKGNYSIGVRAGLRSSDVEIDYIEVSDTKGSGFSAKTKPDCSDGSTNKHDYDGDGKVKYDLDDVVTQDNFTQYNTRIHHNYVHDTGSEGFYIGANRTVYASVGQSGTGPCPTSPTYPLSPVLKGVWIYENILERIGYDAINVKGAVKDCFVYNNKVYGNGLTENRNSYQEGAVTLGINTYCDIYNNYLEGGQGPGIKGHGIGGKIYNNVIVEPGQGHSSSSGRGSAIFVDDGLGNETFQVLNNTLIRPTSYGVYANQKKGDDNRIQNNIVVDPGNGYIQVANKDNVTISHNLQYKDVTSVKFANPKTQDYSLLSESPAIDAGMNLKSEGIIADFMGIGRPFGSGYDVGAYEFGTGSPPDTPTDPYLDIQPIQAEVYPGDIVEVTVSVNNVSDLYGLQVSCAVDPSVLSWQNAQFGDFFTDALIGAKNIDAAAGTWIGAISQKNPAPALSGDGFFATFTFEAVAPGATTVTCEPLASDRDGFEMPMSTSDDSITVLDATSVEGSIVGTITYQGRDEHSGIEVSASGPVNVSTQASSTGQFEIAAVKDGDYDLKADANTYLPSCTLVTVNNGQVATLTAADLIGGDIDDDDQIRINDVTLIGSNFGLNSSSAPTMDSRADINVDGEVNIQDLSILGGNFGKQGCQSWTSSEQPG